MTKIRVLLADDHTLIRAGLRMVVDAHPDLSVVGEAADGRAAVAMAQTLKPDVIVMDIGMPSLNGIEACRKILEVLPETQFVMLSMHSDEGYVLRALKAGAKAYLLKDSAEADLAQAIRAAAAKVVFQSRRRQSTAGRLHAKAATHRCGGLVRPPFTPRTGDPTTRS
jgi:DNA-binding NarL/FixJ family response regulator